MTVAHVKSNYSQDVILRSQDDDGGASYFGGPKDGHETKKLNISNKNKKEHLYVL